MNLHKRNTESSHISNSIVNIHEKSLNYQNHNNNVNVNDNDNVINGKVGSQSYSMTLDNVTCADQVVSNNRLYHTVNNSNTNYSVRFFLSNC